MTRRRPPASVVFVLSSAIVLSLTLAAAYLIGAHS